MYKKFSNRILLIYIVSFVLLCLTSCRTEQVVEPLTPLPEHKFVPEHSPNIFLILYDAEIGKEPILKVIKEYKCEIVYDYHNMNGMALKKPEDKSLEETMQYFRSVKGVLSVEYDHIIRLDDPVKPRLEER